MEGARFERVVVRRPDLRIPFPKRFRSRVEGTTVAALTRRAKYLLGELSSGETLLMHLGMSGSFDIQLPGEERDDGDLATHPGRHDHVLFHMSSGAVVAFNDPRRFGLIDLVPAGEVATHPTLGALGPEPLSPQFDAAALARAVAGKKTSLKVALLDQRVVAGLGNIYVSEALHRARLSPHRRASTIATRNGAPRDAARQLTTAIKEVLEDAIARAAKSGEWASRFRVYEREGARCRHKGCGGVVLRETQAGRSTFYCRGCQR